MSVAVQCAPPAEVLVVIVVWNGLEDTLECLESLQRCEFPHKRILVVDNASSDGSSETIARIYPEIQIIRSERNLGFTGGNNLGLEEAIRQRVRYAFLLNNDTTLAPDALDRLVQRADASPRAGLLAPVIHYYDQPDEIWFAGARVTLSRGEAMHDPVGGLSQQAAPFETDWISGCAMLVRVSAVLSVGVFDPRFYLTWEDVDWCLRMRSAGYRVLVVPASRILHKGGRSGRRLTGIYFYYAVRNSLLVARKHGGSRYWFALWCVILRYGRSALGQRTLQKARALRSVFAGLWHHVAGKYGPAPRSLAGGGRDA
jgi:GT2 family glycosyltransferase